MRTPMTNEERDIRLRLDKSVTQIRRGLKRCPSVDELPYSDLDESDTIVAEVNDALHEALSCTESLEQLRLASEDAVLIASASRTALGLVREILTALSAKIDIQRAAA